MFSIMEAVEAARQRNAEADARRLARQKRMEEEAAMQVQPILPIQPITSGDDGNGSGMVEDTRTPQEKYLDAVKINQSFVTGLPVVGTGIGLMNDYYIQQYEKENPSARNLVPGQRYSTVGRILGFGDPGTTGLGGVFGSNSGLYNAGFHNLVSGGIGYAGAPMEVGGGTIGGVGGGEYSGSADYGQTEATGGTYGERDEQGNVSATPF